MRWSVMCLFVIAVHSTSKAADTTLRVQDRVRYLKDKLKRDLRIKHSHERYIEPIDERKQLETYEVDDGSPITPIMEQDKFKRNEKFKLKRTKTTPAAATVDTTPSFKKKHARMPKKKPLRSATQAVTKALDIFYRKAYSDRNTPIDWLHCSEMISPFLQGAKKEMTKPKQINATDHVVLRLIQLLSMNTTALSKDEVYSVLYQISQLKIRIWSWNLAAIKILFNVIIGDADERIHNFKNIKSGLKKLFESWRLDRSNTTRLLMQSRVFRPPCLAHAHTGSSKFVRGSTITPMSKIKKKHHKDSHESAECNNRAHDHKH